MEEKKRRKLIAFVLWLVVVVLITYECAKFTENLVPAILSNDLRPVSGIEDVVENIFELDRRKGEWNLITEILRWYWYSH